MQNFLVTLAQVNATLLGIFLAAITAYFVFLNDRLATYTEQIGALQVEIGSELHRLNATWPQAFESFVPVQFQEKYREHQSGKSEPAIISQLVTDLIFRPEEVVNIVRESDPSHPEGPWEGRLYIFAISQTVRMLGRGAPAVFPALPGGPGFDQWRDTFNETQGAIELLRMFQSNMIANFQHYIHEYDDETRRMVNDLATKFFTSIDRTQKNMEEIDKLSMLSNKYDLGNRLSWFSLSLTSMLWLILGIVLPLILLAIPSASINTLAAIGILSGAGIFALASGLQFGSDLRERPFDWKTYINQRWYKPILNQLESQATTLKNGGLVETRYIYNALHSRERNRFQAQVVTAMENYLEVSKTYNEKALNLSRTVVATIRANSLIGPLAADYRSMRGGPVLHPGEFVGPEPQFTRRLVDWEARPPTYDQDISVETLGPNWSRVELKIPGDQLYRNPRAATDAFEKVRSEILAKETPNNAGVGENLAASA